MGPLEFPFHLPPILFWMSLQPLNLDAEKRPGAKIEMTREAGWLNTPGFA